MSAVVYEPELAWIDGGFRRGAAICVEDGRISSVGEAKGSGSALAARAMLPGFVNAHSHAFQRAMRGRGETFPEGTGSFWTWREAMYGLVAELDGPTLAATCEQAFGEMLDAGITTVGEFHYLHHDAPGDFAFDEVVLGAAAASGIRIVLLQARYEAAGFGQAMEESQERFRVDDDQQYWGSVDALRESVDGKLQRVGVVAHSLRAVPIDVVVSMAEEAGHRGLPMHLHLEEQRQEVDACVEHHGRRPMELLNEQLAVSPMLTAVHCTHSESGDLEQWIDAGGNICICPLTEANLGDGVAQVSGMTRRGARLCLGTDSNARISMLEEARWLEYGQRLAREARGIAAAPDGRMDTTLIDAATTSGAAALGTRGGRIDVGRDADFALIDLSVPALAGIADEDLAMAIICGAGNAAIAGTIVAGGEIRPTRR